MSTLMPQRKPDPLVTGDGRPRLAIFVPSVNWHHEVWGFALQYAMDTQRYRTVHLHVKNETHPPTQGYEERHRNPDAFRKMWARWRAWVEFYTLEGLFQSPRFRILIDADFQPSDYDFVLVPTATEHWLVPLQMRRLFDWSELRRIAHFAMESAGTLMLLIFDWRPGNVLFFDHGAEGRAFSWNHVKIRNYHRRHMMTCFRGRVDSAVADKQHRRLRGPGAATNQNLIVAARGGDESILRLVARLPNVTLRLMCDRCDDVIPGAEMVPTHEDPTWAAVRTADVYLVARSGSYLKDQLNGAIPIAISYLVPVVMPFAMAFDMGYDGSQFIHSFGDVPVVDDAGNWNGGTLTSAALQQAIEAAHRTDRTAFRQWRDRNVRHNNALIDAFAVGANARSKPLWDAPYLRFDADY